MILGFVLLFRLGDFVIGNMTTPFLLDIGFTLTDVGAVQGAVGIAATIAGALGGGALAARIGLLRALWIAGALQALSNLTYVILAQAGPNYRIMVSTVVIENVCYGLATGTLVGFLMSLCNPRFSATQYALLSSVISAGRDILVSYSGALAQMLGWPAFFVVSLIAALPGLALLPIFAPWAAGNAQLRTDTARHHWFAD
jgi:PAT family beta-lactamase induction signal transducer AmpG